MSKQSEAKESQGYVAKPVWPTCANCNNFTSERETKFGPFHGTYTTEKNLRCSVGGFKVAKLGTCKSHEVKPKE